MRSTMRKAVVATACGLGLMLTSAGPTLADGEPDVHDMVSAQLCVKGGGHVVHINPHLAICVGGKFNGQIVV